MNHEDTKSLTIGQPFEGGHFGGIVRIGSTLIAIAWAPKALGETKMAWLPKNKQIAGASSCCDSMANTVAMAEAGSPLAKWAQSLDIAGHTDWCIPARDVLELGYRHLKPTDYETDGSFRDGDNPSSVPVGYPYANEASPTQTTAESFKAGGPEAFEANWYWASTQCSYSYAWGQTFNYGGQDFISKSYEGRARAVRMIQLDS